MEFRQHGRNLQGMYMRDFQHKRKKPDHSNDTPFIDFTFDPPSLEIIAAVAVMIPLLSEPGVRDIIEQPLSSFSSFHKQNFFEKSNYKVLEKKILKKLDNMKVPYKLKTRISNVLRPMALELFKGYESMEDGYNLFYDLYKRGSSLCWTMTGSIDKVKSLEAAIDTNTDLNNLKELYCLACKYCLADRVKELWKKGISSQNEILFDKYYTYNNHYVAFWTALLQNKLPNFLFQVRRYDSHRVYDTKLSLNQNMISLSVFVGNALAFKYFWNKLSKGEVAGSINYWIEKLIDEKEEDRPLGILPRVYLEYNERTEILCHLLSHLSDSSEQKEVFQKYPYYILRLLFFSWPCQDFFLTTAGTVLKNLDDKNYMTIVFDVFNQISKGSGTSLLFRELWKHSTPEFKHQFFNNYPMFWKMCKPAWRLLSAGDFETVILILKDGCQTDIIRFFDSVIEDFKSLFDIVSNQLQLFDKVLITVLPLPDIKAIKENIKKKHARPILNKFFKRCDLQSAQQFLNWLFPSPYETSKFKKHSLQPLDVCYPFICKGDYKSLNRFVNWFFKGEDRVSEFKTDIANAPYDKDVLMLKLCDCGVNTWNRFEAFIDWSTEDFTDRQFSQLKKLYLKCIHCVLSRGKFVFANRLLNWCVDNFIKEVQKFKGKLLLSDRMIDLLLNDKKNGRPEPELLLKWFAPISDQVLSEFRVKLNEVKPLKKNKMRELIRIVDSLELNKYKTYTFEKDSDGPDLWDDNNAADSDSDSDREFFKSNVFKRICS